MAIGGLDIGTTGAKITVVGDTGGVLYAGYLDYPVSRKTDMHEVDAKEIWKTVRALLSEAAKAVSQITAVGVTSFGESFVLTDENGEALLPTMLYTDPRGSEEANRLRELLGDDAVFATTGTTPHPMYTLPKLMWVKNHRPEIFDKAKYVFLIADYIVFQLTGERKIDYSLAARTLGFNIRDFCWSREMFMAAELDESIFSSPVPSGTAAGTLRKRLSAEFGLPEDVKIVICGHDQVTAAVGSGVTSPGHAANGAGTVECVTPVFRKIPEGDGMQKGNYPIVPFLGNGLYCCYAFLFTGGSLLSWFIRRFIGGQAESLQKDGKSVYKTLESQMNDAPTGILVLPHFAGAATPYMDTGSKGAFVGLTLAHTSADLYRAVMEGIVYEVRINLDRLNAGGVPVKSLNACGGCARSERWLQMKADILGIPVNRLGNDEAGTMGGIMMTAIAEGMFQSLDEAAREMISVSASFEPRREMHERYMEHYARYQKLYGAVRSLMTDA